MKKLSIVYTNQDDIDLVKSFSKKVRMPMTKALIHSINLSEEIHLNRGKIATLEFLNRELFRDLFSQKKR
jgi:hypothetical protein